MARPIGIALAAIRKNKVLVLALAASALWHLFWISAVKVVVVPENIQAVRFSKISFLGPVIGGRVLEVRMAARPRSLLEDRYERALDRLFPWRYTRQGGDFVKDFYELREGDLYALLKEVSSGAEKIPLPAYSE